MHDVGPALIYSSGDCRHSHGNVAPMGTLLPWGNGGDCDSGYRIRKTLLLFIFSVVAQVD